MTLFDYAGAKALGADGRPRRFSLANLEHDGRRLARGRSRKEERYAQLVGSADYLSGRFWADTWCAAFVWKKTKEFDYAITEDVFRRIERNPHDCTPWMRAEIQRLGQQYQFFHWHLAFPQVFRVPQDGEEPESEESGWSGGFDIVLGNPPWEKVKLQDAEWFAESRPDIADAPSAAVRRKIIESVAQEDPSLFHSYKDALRQSAAESHLLRSTGLYPLCGRGDINLFAVFAESMRTRISSHGRVGCVVPTGIAIDDTTKDFFDHLVCSRSLISLFDFGNDEDLFPAVRRHQHFCLLTVAGDACVQPSTGIAFGFFLTNISQMREEGRSFVLSTDDICLMNPNTRTAPIFKTRYDADLTRAIYQRVPVLVKERPSEVSLWGISFARLFDMTNDSEHFRTGRQLEESGGCLKGNHFLVGPDCYVPLFDPKMAQQYQPCAEHHSA